MVWPFHPFQNYFFLIKHLQTCHQLGKLQVCNIITKDMDILMFSFSKVTEIQAVQFSYWIDQQKCTCNYCTMAPSASNSLYITSWNSKILSLWTHASSRQYCRSIFTIKRRINTRNKLGRGNSTYSGTQTKLPFASIAPTPHQSNIWNSQKIRISNKS